MGAARGKQEQKAVTGATRAAVTDATEQEPHLRCHEVAVPVRPDGTITAPHAAGLLQGREAARAVPHLPGTRGAIGATQQSLHTL